MGIASRCLFLLTGVAITSGLGISSGEELSLPETNLQRIRDKVAEHLSLLPNYTCHEVIDRFEDSFSRGGSRQHDRVELEVAFVGGKELFGRPGEALREESITRLVPTGTIGSGVFGAHAGSIFLTGAASFTYIGLSQTDGHMTHRYDFKVPVEMSGFLVRHDHAEGIVGYQGSVWADVATFDLVRLEIIADQIPSSLGVTFIKETADYTTVRIGNSDFLLPLHAEMEGRDSSGIRSVDDLTLGQCREFTGESTVTFGAPVNSSSAGHQPRE